MGSNIRQLLVAMVGLACVAMLGCGTRASKKVVQGDVVCGGEKVSLGQVVFLPIDNTHLSPSTAPIVDGKYRVDAGGGVPLGKYRVRVDALKKTGRKVKGNNGFETTTIDEIVGMGPPVYAGEQSPLIVAVTTEFDGTFDIAMPRQ